MPSYNIQSVHQALFKTGSITVASSVWQCLWNSVKKGTTLNHRFFTSVGTRWDEKRPRNCISFSEQVTVMHLSIAEARTSVPSEYTLQQSQWLMIGIKGRGEIAALSACLSQLPFWGHLLKQSCLQKWHLQLSGYFLFQLHRQKFRLIWAIVADSSPVCTMVLFCWQTKRNLIEPLVKKMDFHMHLWNNFRFLCVTRKIRNLARKVAWFLRGHYTKLFVKRSFHKSWYLKAQLINLVYFLKYKKKIVWVWKTARNLIISGDNNWTKFQFVPFTVSPKLFCVKR